MYQQLNLKNKINERVEQKQTHGYRERFDNCQMGGCLEDWVKNVKGLRSTNLLLQNSHGDAKYSIGSIVGNSLMTLYGIRWCKTYRHDHLVSYVIFSPWGVCRLEAYMMMYMCSYVIENLKNDKFKKNPFLSF